MRPIALVLFVLAIAAGATAFVLLSGDGPATVGPARGDTQEPSDPGRASPAPPAEKKAAEKTAPQPHGPDTAAPETAVAPVRVVSRATSKAIAGATLAHGDRTWRTDADGRASAPIGVSVRVEAPGFVTGIARVTTRDGVGRIALPAAATITGIVRDPTTTAVAGVSVRVAIATESPLPDPEGFAVIVPPIGVVTGADGRFEVSAPSAVPLVVDALGGFGGPARYGATLALGPGERREIQLPFRPAGVLQGTVLGAGGAPVAGATITLGGTADVALSVDGYSRTAETADDGGFAIDGVPLGAWRLVASPPAGARFAAAVATVRIDKHGEVATSQIRLETGRTIRGRVLGPRGAPAGGIPVEGSWPGGLTARSAADGTFAVGPVPSGAHRVRALGTGELGNSRWTDVAADDTTVELRLTVAGNVAIAVTGPDGKPVAATVELRSVDWGLDEAATTQARELRDGSARFGPIAEGRYIAIVRDQKRYALDGPFAVTAGAETTRTIVLRDGAHATIVVKQPAGAPPIEQPVAKIVCDGIQLARGPVGAFKAFQVPASRRVAIRVEYRQGGVDKHIEHRLSLPNGTNEFVEVP